MQTVELLMKILKIGVLGEGKLNVVSLSSAQLQELYSISKKHDLAHLVGFVLEQNNLLDKQSEIGKKFNEQIKMAVYRITNIEYDYGQICQILSDAKIPFIPLKGAVIREYYPEPWLRTSCDIDILVKEKDLKRACKVLENAGLKNGGASDHDVNFYSQSGTHFELHFLLTSQNSNFDKLLPYVWDNSYPKEDNSFEYSMNNEFFIYYLLAHSVKHFSNGGCGIRHILDMWLISQCIKIKKENLYDILDQSQLTKFYHAIMNLADCWFSNREYDDLTKKISHYILTGGVYGTKDNLIILNLSKNKGENKHLLSRLFPSYKKMAIRNPILKKMPILLPFFWISRILSLIFKKDRARKAINEVKVSKNVSQNQVDEMADMLDELGLN